MSIVTCRVSKRKLLPWQLMGGGAKLALIMIGATSFYELTPDRVLDAVETSGYQCTGRCSALNSYENRVYDVELEKELKDSAGVQWSLSTNRCVVKFYRPQRWSREQILEEHEFLAELSEADIPVVRPLPFPDGETLQLAKESGLFFAVFPKVYGRPPYELGAQQLYDLGRLLGELHDVGAQHEAQHRLRLTPQTYGIQNLEFLLKENQIPAEFAKRYESAVTEICRIAQSHFEEVTYIRIHGDCHAGNILWGDEGPFFMDFDDMVQGPEVQDFWLLVSGKEAQDRRNMESFLEGYESVRSFDRSQLSLVEALRALRYVHFSAWIARRWNDPAFPLAFPEFGSHKYWDGQTRDLEDQLSLVKEALG